MNQKLKFFESDALAQLSYLGPIAIKIIFVLILTAILWKAIRIGIRKIEKRMIAVGEAHGESFFEAQKRIQTLMRLAQRGALTALLALSAAMVLAQMGISIAPLIAGAGFFGVAVGFGSQTLVKDLISGFFLIIENQIRVGDIVVINGATGTVEAVNFRTTLIRDFVGGVHVFPNGSFDTVRNLTKDWSAYELNVGVAYKDDVDQVITVMKTLGAEIQEFFKNNGKSIEPIEVFGLDQFADSSVVIRGRIKTQPGIQWEVGREFNRRLKIAFDNNGIEIPFPQRVIHTIK